MRLVGYPLALLASLMLVGGHWGALQTIAWAGMLNDYISTYGVADGIEKTFNGENPCSMCLKVEEGKKKEEQKSPLFKADKKSENLIASSSLFLQKPGSHPSPRFSWESESASARNHPPSSPPPRSLS